MASDRRLAESWLTFEPTQRARGESLFADLVSSAPRRNCTFLVDPDWDCALVTRLKSKGKKEKEKKSRKKRCIRAPSRDSIFNVDLRSTVVDPM